jgi:hypothetical protein
MKDMFKFKNQFQFKFLRDANFKQRLFEKLGIIETADVSDEIGKMTFKHKIVNKKEFNIINHHNTHHTKAL